MIRLIVITCFFLISSCAQFEEKPNAFRTDQGKYDSLMVALDENIELNNNFATATTDSFPSLDSLFVYADLYPRLDVAPNMLLCHQAGYSRGEFIYAANQLKKLGYSCVSVDLRSGREVKDVKNRTFLNAKNRGLPTNFLDARKDLKAAINYTYQKNNQEPIILIGSSYSASLAILEGRKNPKIKAVIAFSPGEYFEGYALRDSLKNFPIPLFVTNSETENKLTKDLLAKLDSSKYVHFKPDFAGIHGASALWPSTEGFKDYWKHLVLFLNNL